MGLDSVATTQQTAPTGDGADVTDLVVRDLMERREAGTRKYGQPLRTFNGRNAVVDAYQEALDLTVYLRQHVEEQGRGVLAYLAQPYSDPDPAVREARFQAGCRAAGALMARGVLVFAPIPHTHPIACACELPKGWDFWQRFDAAVLRACGRLIVLMLPGWQESVGVAAEIRMATAAGMVVSYLSPGDFSERIFPPDDGA